MDNRRTTKRGDSTNQKKKSSSNIPRKQTKSRSRSMLCNINSEKEINLWEISEVGWTHDDLPMETVYQNESIWLVALKLIELVLQDVEKRHIYTIREV